MPAEILTIETALNHLYTGLPRDIYTLNQEALNSICKKLRKVDALTQENVEKLFPHIRFSDIAHTVSKLKDSHILNSETFATICSVPNRNRLAFTAFLALLHISGLLRDNLENFNNFVKYIPVFTSAPVCNVVMQLPPHQGLAQTTFDACVRHCAHPDTPQAVILVEAELNALLVDIVRPQGV